MGTYGGYKEDNVHDSVIAKNEGISYISCHGKNSQYEGNFYNITVMSHTKHVDMKYKYVNEYKEDIIIND